MPPEYLGHELWVRWDRRLVRIFNERMQPICIHTKQPMGKFSTLPEHISSKKISNVERGAEWLLLKVSIIGPHTSQWAKTLVTIRGVESVRVLQGLVNLTTKHSSMAIDNACRIALSYESFRLKTVRELINRAAPEQQAFHFLEEHPIIRKMSDYGDLVRVSFRKEAQER